MKIWLFLKEKWKLILGVVVGLTGFFLTVFNRKLRAKVVVLEGKIEDAKLDQKQTDTQAELDKLNTQLDSQPKPEVKNEEDIDKLADYFNTRKPS